MTTTEPASHPNLVRAAAFCLCIAVLYLGASLLIPLTYSVFLSFIIAPLVSRLGRWGIPNPVATAGVLSGIAAVLIGVLWLTSSQALDLLNKIPEYRENLIQRVRSIRTSTDKPLSDLQKTVETIGKEITKPTTAATSTATTPQPEPRAPVAVQIVSSTTDIMSTAGNVLSPVLGPFAMISVVFLLSYFIVVGRESLWRKFHRISARLYLFDAIEGVEEASARVVKYLRAQLTVNTLYGLTVALTLILLGVPNALMWGLLGGLLRYIPYLGPLIGIAMPTALSLAVSTGWTQPILTLGFLLALETIVNALLEPMFYGSSTGVSALGVVLSTIFWGWLWGGAGLLLGMPLTVSLVVIGQHVRPLRIISELLSSEEDPTQSFPGSDQPNPLAPVTADNPPSPTIPVHPA